MAGSVIGALRVMMGLDTAAFERGLTGASKQLALLQKSMAASQASISGLGAIVTAVAGGAFVSFIKNAAKVGDEIGETAERLGMSVEGFQELAFAAKLANVEQEEFVKALDIFNKKLGDFKGGVTGAQSALGQLGLTVADIKALKPEDQFKLVADRIAAIPDPMRRAAVEAELFGKTGMKLDGVLREGAAGLEKIAAEARKMGLILSTDTIKAARAADDEFDKMGLAMKVAGVNIAVGFLPALIELRKIMTSPEFQDGVKSLAKNFGDFVLLLVNNREVVAGLAAAFAAWRLGSIAGPVAAGTLAFGAFVVAMQAAKAEIKQVEEALERTHKQLEAAREAAATRGGLLGVDAGANVKKLEQDARDLTVQLMTLKQAAQDTKLTINQPGPPPPWTSPEVLKATEDLAFKTRVLKGEFAGLAVGFPETAKSLQVPLAMIGTSAATLHPQLQALNAELLRFEGAKLTQEFLDPWDKYALKLAEINQLLAAGTISQETYEEASRKAAATAMQGQLNYASTFASTLTQVFKKNKAAAVAAAIINTSVAVMKTFSEYGYTPWGIALAALQAAAGVVQIAEIKKQNMAAGGLVSGPGTATSDSIPAMLSAGEFVVNAAATRRFGPLLKAINVGAMPMLQQGGEVASFAERAFVPPAESGGRGSRGDQTVIPITLNGRGYSREDVRGLIEQINEAVGDGVLLKIA
jgi:hypothetical protein